MTIAVDIDGVLTDLDLFRKKEGSCFFKKEIMNPEGLDVDEIFEVSKEEKTAFWDANFLNYIKSFPYREEAKDVFAELHRLGHKILIVTARKYSPKYACKDEEEFKNLTKNILEARGIYYDEIYFVSWPKKCDSLDKKIAVFIEDDKANIAALAKDTNVIIMDAPYNRNIDIPYTYRAYNLIDALNIIKKMQS